MKDPDAEDLLPAHITYFQKALNHLNNGIEGLRCETAEFGTKYNQCPGQTLLRDISYSDVLDTDSWIDYFLHSELVKNPDGYANSRYYYKDRDTGITDSDFGRIHSGPVWDLNLCFGQVETMTAEGWLYVTNGDYAYLKLLANPSFAFEIVHRWFLLRSNMWSTESIAKIIQGKKNLITFQGYYEDSAVYRDHQRWTRGPTMQETFMASTEKLESFLSSRTSWIDVNICNLISNPSACTDDNYCVHGMCRCGQCLCSIGWEGSSCNDEVAIIFTITLPVQDTSWTVGVTSRITWNVELMKPSNYLAGLPEEFAPTVDITLLHDRTEYEIVTSTKNDRSYTWKVDDTVIPNTGYRVRIKKSGSSFQSFSLPFTIYRQDDRQFTITHPSSSQGPYGPGIYRANEEITITWQSTGDIDDVDVYYSDIDDNRTPI